MSYSSRREQVMSQMCEGGVAIFRNPALREGKYRPDSDFYYLTGFDEPNAVCLLVPGHDEHRFVLFVQPKDRKAEIWTGVRLGVEKARELLGADAVYPIDELDIWLPRYLDDASAIYYRFGREEDFNRQIIDLLRGYQGKIGQDIGPRMLIDSGEIVHEMRVIKDETELALMREAARITTEAHIAAMKTVEPGMFEYEIEALVSSIYRKRGGNGPAYPPIIASGPNALILHYETNNRRIEDGDLVLMDTGAEFGYYDSDVTRTIPANGRFTGAQRAVYDVVLHAQKCVIDTVKPGNTMADYRRAAHVALTEGLVELGLLKGEIDSLVESGAYRRFYMHSPGHWIGLDTHDVGKYELNGRSRTFEPGMVITPDTALYIDDADDIDTEYRNIGIRIEDDVLVTESGCEVLTKEIPKLPDEIEALVR